MMINLSIARKQKLHENFLERIVTLNKLSNPAIYRLNKMVRKKLLYSKQSLFQSRIY